ncbi:MAG: GldG family protein [Clostridiales bacterium]|nr:GldG family protein [Clostridiales bacterium]
MKLKDKFNKWFGTKDFKLGGYSAAAAVIVAAIGVAVVMMTDALPSSYTSFDMSGKNLYSISNETKNIVKGLDKEVNIYLIARESDKDTITDRMLQKYASLSGNIKYSVQDPAKNPNFTKQYTDEKVSQNSVIVVCGDKSRYISSSDIYNTQYNSDYSQTTEFDGENCVTSAITYVTSDDTPKLYTLSGHGEAALDSSFKSLTEDKNIESADLTLIDKDAVPEDADFVLINEPQSDLSEQEVSLLKQYGEKGGNIIVVSGYIQKTLPNLNTLLNAYGCELEADMIIEGDRTKCIQGYNYYLVPSISSHDITSPLIDENYFVLAPLSVNIKHTDGSDASVTDILKTSDKAYVKADAANAQSLEKADGDKSGQYTVGVVSTKGSSDKESKLLLVSASQFLTGQSNMIVSGGNGDLFLNALSWMSGREEGIAIHAKSLSSEKLTIPDTASGTLGFVVIFLIPAAVIALGAYVLVKRKRR